MPTRLHKISRNFRIQRPTLHFEIAKIGEGETKIRSVRILMEFNDSDAHGKMFRPFRIDWISGVTALECDLNSAL